MAIATLVSRSIEDTAHPVAGGTRTATIEAAAGES